MSKKKRLMQGNEACSHGAIYAGCRFFAGYPITPSTEIAENMANLLPKYGGYFIEMEDEIAAMGAVIGASLGGGKTLTATSGPGFSLKQEHIGFACIAEIPCVIINVMRGGPSTGFPTGPSQSDIMQARWGTHGDHPTICLTPSTVSECFTETVRAFNLSEKYRTPVIVTYDEIVGHMREQFIVPEPGELEIINREKPSCGPEEYRPFGTWSNVPDVPVLAPFGEGYRFHVTGLNHRDDGFPTNDGKLIDREERRMMRKVNSQIDDIIKIESINIEDADIGVFAYGSTARSAKRAVKMARENGIRAGLLKPLTIWPFPEKEVFELAKRVKAIIVPEMSLGQIIFEVERTSKGKCDISGINSVDAEPISPSMIFDAIKKFK
ncbi:MAG TPA: 2-oxoacid:acceptor oxidoreductase subunit alpha [bacterium]